MVVPTHGRRRNFSKGERFFISGRGTTKNVEGLLVSFSFDTVCRRRKNWTDRMFVNHVLIMFFQIIYFLESISRRYTECDVKSHSFSPCSTCSLAVSPENSSFHAFLVRRDSEWEGGEERKSSFAASFCSFQCPPRNTRLFMLVTLQ